MIEPRPLSPTWTPEVPLARAPLARVIAQARFPPILAIRIPDKVAVVQEALRDTYPNLSQDQVHSVELTGGRNPEHSSGPHLATLPIRRRTPAGGCRWGWTSWPSKPLPTIVGTTFSAAFACRRFRSRGRRSSPRRPTALGLRYIDRLTDEAVDRIGDLIQPGRFSA